MSELNEQDDSRTEEEIDQEIAERLAGKKKRGRPKNENYLSFEEARNFMRGELLPSRGKFFEWWERNKPKAIPRFPYRVYQEEWTSWNDFLGTNNKFNEKIGTKWRSLQDSTTFVHTLGLQTQGQWMEFCRADNKLPEDIPARPDLVYDTWRSWSHWLGNKPVEAIQAKQEAAKVQVYYIIHEHGDPGNVLYFGIEPTITGMKERWQRGGMDIIRLFWYDPAKAAQVKQIVESLSSAFEGYERHRIVPNVWEIVWHLQMHLESIEKA